MTLQFEGVGFGTGTGSGGKIGTVVLVAMGSQPSTPYTVGSKWFYNGKIYTATTTTATDGGVDPSYDTAYLYNGTYYYWDGSTLQGADESNLVHISGTETITGDKTFSGTNNLGDATSATTQPTSDTSDKVATTKFVKDFAEDGEWQKPADWVDIRSGALNNSIYLLMAHSAPVLNDGVYTIENNTEFKFHCNVSDSGTYDVWIDGKKIFTKASEEVTVINWADLYNSGQVDSGFNINYPSSLVSHIVRITPTDSNNHITLINSNNLTAGSHDTLILWGHFEIDNSINISSFFGRSYGNGSSHSYYLEAVTAKNDKIIISVADSSFIYAQSLVKIPTLECYDDTTNRARANLLYSVKANLKITKNSETTDFEIFRNYKGKIVDIENPLKFSNGNSTSLSDLKRLPRISTTQKGDVIRITRLENLEETFIDESFNDIRRGLRVNGVAGHISNIVGLIVSSSAPFDYTAPQINISYTTMNRASLVRLFNSMPTVSDGQEIDITGATGAGDLTAEDLAIATGKGWTVTR